MNLLSKLFFFFSFIVFAQTDSLKVNGSDKTEQETRKVIVSARDIETNAIYPKCDKQISYIKSKNRFDKNSILRECFINSFTKDVSRHLNNRKLKNYSKEKGLKKLEINLRFQIDTLGNITNIDSKTGGNKFLSNQVMIALRKVSKRLKSKSKIIPATYDDTKTEDFFSIPFVYYCKNCKRENKQKLEDTVIEKEDLINYVNGELNNYREIITRTIFYKDKYYQVRKNLEQRKRLEQRLYLQPEHFIYTGNRTFLYEISKNGKDELNRYELSLPMPNEELGLIYEKVLEQLKKDKFLISFGYIDNEKHTIYGIIENHRIIKYQVFKTTNNGETLVEEIELKNDQLYWIKMLKSKYNSLWFIK